MNRMNYLMNGLAALAFISFYFHNVLAKLTIKLPMLRLRLMPNCQE